MTDQARAFTLGAALGIGAFALLLVYLGVLGA